MQTTIRKWGNSLAVRIPKPFAAELGLAEDSAVELRVSDGTLVIAPAARLAYRLADLVTGIRRSNLHGEVSSGARRGKEIW